MTSQMRTRTVAPHQFLPRRRSLGQELRLIANRSGEPSAGLPLSPVIHKKRPASVDNSQLDKCPRSLNDLCSSPQKTPNLPKHKAETSRRRSVPNKTGSLFLRRMTSNGGLESILLPGGELKPYDLLAQALSPLAAMSPGSVTRARIFTAPKTIAGIPGLECQSSRRMNTSSPMPKYTTTHTDRLHPIATNQPIPVRLSVSPVAFRDQTFNAFGGRAGFSSTMPKGMSTSPTDAARSQPAPGSFSRSPKLPTTPQNIPPAATQFFPTFGSYLPTTGTAPGYYFPILNGTSGAYYPHMGNLVGSLYPGPLSNCRQYHQVLGANGSSLGSYYAASNEGLMQAGTYVGTLVSNNISPGLPTQNNQFYYPVPVINSNNFQYITTPSPNMCSSNPNDQTSWSYVNRMTSPNQIVDSRHSQSTINLNALPSGDSIQWLQAEGAGLSPSRLGPLVYQTSGLTIPTDNNGVLYPVNSGQSKYQTNGEVLNVINQSEPLPSPKPRNGSQMLPFLSNMRPSPRKKMAALISQGTARPGINQTENQWLSNSLSHWQRPLN